LTKDQFIEALGDSEITWNVFQSRPRNLTDALKVALELDAFKESERSRLRKNIRGVGPEDDIVNAIGSTDNNNDMSSVLQHMLAEIRQLGGVATDAAQTDGMQSSGDGGRGVNWPDGKPPVRTSTPGNDSNEDRKNNTGYF
jgi:hypothetical protein